MLTYHLRIHRIADEDARIRLFRNLRPVEIIPIRSFRGPARWRWLNEEWRAIIEDLIKNEGYEPDGDTVVSVLCNTETGRFSPTLWKGRI